MPPVPTGPGVGALSCAWRCPPACCAPIWPQSLVFRSSRDGGSVANHRQVSAVLGPGDPDMQAQVFTEDRVADGAHRARASGTRRSGAEDRK
jgi:hypothetical protein